MSASQRRKGHEFERKIAAMLRELGIETRRGGQSWRADPLAEYAGKEPDVLCGPPLENIWIECKVGSRPNVWAAMDQACRDATPGRTPIVIAHRDRGRTLVCIELGDWLEMLREQIEKGEK